MTLSQHSLLNRGALLKRLPSQAQAQRTAPFFSIPLIHEEKRREIHWLFEWTFWHMGSHHCIHRNSIYTLSSCSNSSPPYCTVARDFSTSSASSTDAHILISFSPWHPCSQLYDRALAVCLCWIHWIGVAVTRMSRGVRSAWVYSIASSLILKGTLV